MEPFSFPKSVRLLRRQDFVNLNQFGRRHLARHFAVVYRKNGLGMSRVGITVSKRMGNAVKRNRVKRLIREYFRLHRVDIPEGFDIVISARKGAVLLDFHKTTEELSKVVFA